MPFVSPEAYKAVVGEVIPELAGLLPDDVFHQFYFRADLPDGSFWGFGGYAVVRSGCVVHAAITSYDN